MADSSKNQLSDVDVDTPSLRLRLVTGDAIAAALAWVIPFAISGPDLAERMDTNQPLASILAVVLLAVAVGGTLLLLAMRRLYLSRVCAMRTVEISRIGGASLVIGAMAVLGGKLVDEAHLVRTPVAVAVLAFFLLNIWRLSYASWLRQARKNGRFVRSVILVGANDDAQNMYRLIRSHPELGYRIRGVIGKRSDFADHDFDDLPLFGETNELRRVLQETGIKGAFVAGGALNRRALNTAIRLLLEEGVHVHLSTGINGIDHRRLQSHSLAYEPMVYVERADLEGWQIGVKRIMDIVLAGIVLLIASPVMLVSAFLIKRHDGGPVVFRQERVGRHGKPFGILKFRSMVTDAEAKQIELQAQNVRQGPLFKLARDPRVTPIGRILRATSIDELPQLINVIRGDMSLVGPRPALRAEVEKFEEALLARQNVLPGITGLWQVEGRDNPDFTLYQRLDLFYVENWSVALDLSILTATAKVVVTRAWASLTRHNARRHGGGSGASSTGVESTDSGSVGDSRLEAVSVVRTPVLVLD